MARHKLPRIDKALHGADRCLVCVGEGFLLGSPGSIKNKAGDVVFVHRPFFICPDCHGAGMKKQIVDAVHLLHSLRLPSFLGIRRSA